MGLSSLYRGLVAPFVCWLLGHRPRIGRALVPRQGMPARPPRVKKIIVCERCGQQMDG